MQCFSEMWWDGFKKNWNSQTRLVGTLRGFFLKTGTDNKLDERHTMWESIKKFHVHTQWEVVMWGFFSIGFYKQWQCYFVVCCTPVSQQGFHNTATPPICALHVNSHGVWHKYMCLSTTYFISDGRAEQPTALSHLAPTRGFLWQWICESTSLK